MDWKIYNCLKYCICIWSFNWLFNKYYFGEKMVGMLKVLLNLMVYYLVFVVLSGLLWYMFILSFWDILNYWVDYFKD